MHDAEEILKGKVKPEKGRDNEKNVKSKTKKRETEGRSVRKRAEERERECEQRKCDWENNKHRSGCVNRTMEMSVG